MTDLYQRRLARLRELAAGYDLIALVPGSDLYYVTGVHYHLSNDRPLVVFFPTDGGEATAVIAKLEEQRLLDHAKVPIKTFAYNDAEGFIPAFQRAALALRLAGKRIGAEGMRMRLTEAQLLEEIAPGARVTSADAELMKLRLYKTPEEIAYMRAAIATSERALADLLDDIDGSAVGMTEMQITSLLLAKLSANGGVNSFDPIVLTGANSALPHGQPGTTAIKRGDLLLFDYGTKVEGYPADITRTFGIGEVSDELRRMYETVRAANAAGIAAGKPGIAAQEVDRAARKVITEAGYGQYFTHRTGHGLGLDVHEHPNMREGNEMILEPGMLYTVEPGVYVPGLGGVRVEDNVLVTETSVDVLTTFPKALRILKG